MDLYVCCCYYHYYYYYYQIKLYLFCVLTYSWPDYNILLQPIIADSRSSSRSLVPTSGNPSGKRSRTRSTPWRASSTAPCWRSNWTVNSRPGSSKVTGKCVSSRSSRRTCRSKSTKMVRGSGMSGLKFVCCCCCCVLLCYCCCYCCCFCCCGCCGGCGYCCYGVIDSWDCRTLTFGV